jgi:hypothetical protein
MNTLVLLAAALAAAWASVAATLFGIRLQRSLRSV